MVNSTDSTKVIDTNASSSAHGWDFQSNAAILLALKHIKDLESLKVEGDIDDIELYLKDNKRIFAQAKSQENPNPSTNTLSKLREALKTLINATNQSDYEKIIYISNIKNPLNHKNLDYYFGPYFVRYPYMDLEDAPKKIIERYINNIALEHRLDLSKLDYNKLEICAFPFFGTDDETRYRIIYEDVKQFLFNSEIDAANGMALDVMNYWQNLFFQNAANRYVELNKEELIWPVVVLDSFRLHYTDFFEDYDLGEVKEIDRQYDKFIQKKTEQFEFVTQVINGFNEFRNSNRNLLGKQAVNEFVQTKWQLYASFITDKSIKPEIKEAVIKLIIIKILNNRYTIDSIKKAAGLS